MTKKRETAALIIGYIGSMLGLFGVRLFNRYILMTLPLWARMISMIVLYWLIALVPIVLIALNKEKLNEYGFSEEKLGYQIAVGVLVGAAMSAVLTLLPHLLGFGEYFISEKNYTEAVPAYICIIAMPLFYSISEGISLGIISYTIINMACGKAKSIPPLIYVLSVLFVLKYIFL